MFSAPHPLAAHGCQDQSQTAFLSRAVATAGTGGVWAFFHETNVHHTDDTVIPKGTYADTYSMKPQFWPGTNISKSTGNGFTVPAESAFATDKNEMARATLHRKQSFYGSAKGTACHGHAVMPTLSVKAQKLLKATPYSAPIAPSRSGLSKVHRVTTPKKGGI